MLLYCLKFFLIINKKRTVDHVCSIKKIWSKSNYLQYCPLKLQITSMGWAAWGRGVVKNHHRPLLMFIYFLFLKSLLSRVTKSIWYSRDNFRSLISTGYPIGILIGTELPDSALGQSLAFYHSRQRLPSCPQCFLVTAEFNKCDVTAAVMGSLTDGGNLVHCWIALSIIN